VQFSYLPPRRQSNASIYENSILLNDCLPQWLLTCSTSCTYFH
jgi:hypothetical protein